MLCDSHVHIGQFYDLYTAPKQIAETMESLGVDHFAVSSTTICERDYSKVLNEIDQIYSIASPKVNMVLWLTPELLKNENYLNSFLNTGYEWSAIKIHPDLNPFVWNEDDKLFSELVSLCKELKVPLLIHTGANSYSEIRCWESKLIEYSDQLFIFAHCRPFEQALQILSTYKNAFGDMSFIPSENFDNLINRGLSKKIIWGTDIPINTFYYPQITTQDYVGKRLKKLRMICSDIQFSEITEKNYLKLFIKN